MSLFPFFKSTPQLSRFPVSVETFDVILQFDDLQSLVLPLGGLLNLLQNLRVRLRGLPHDLQRRAAMGAGDEAHAFICHVERHTTALVEHGDDFLGGDSEKWPARCQFRPRTLFLTLWRKLLVTLVARSGISR